MTVENIRGVSQAAFEIVLKAQPTWLKDYKRSAWDVFNNMTLNGKREKFSEVIESLEIENKNLINTLSEPVNMEEFRNQWGDLDGCFVSNGSTFLNEELAKKGVILKSLKLALTENEDLVKQYLTKNNLTAKDSRFTALAEALWTDGVFMYVPKDTEVSLPIHLLKWTDKGNGQNYYKTLIVVEEGSKVLLIDEFNSENTNEFFLVDGVNEIHVKDNANVTYIHLQNLDYNAFNFSLQKAILGKGSELLMLSLSMGAQFSYENIRTYMEKSGSNAEILGLVIGEKEQVFQHETLQYHPSPSAQSNLHFEVMLKDKAESAHNGFVQIEKQAQKTDARQLIRNLLLSRKAKAEAIPNLEILADDVKCAHGVSLGPVNPEELFYLESRGFNPEQSSNFIIEGTIESIMNKLAKKTNDEDDEDVAEENYFDETATLATRVRDYVLDNLAKREVK
ncbi:MAG: Fe-S cluster assembly protein SufD [Candidatus Sericytochromatia bacterium]|nr:Fe-S cluster assembly protein SufD [Candidatus Sericytochromatia bacterium]